MDHQPAKFQCGRMSLAGFMDKFLKKHNDDVVMTCCMLLGFENLTFCKTKYLSKSQISWLSGLNFMKVSVRPPNTIMTSL